ncbi:phosphotransferase [Blastopirellula sp. JC732]|uniref:Phosphotransferase n=2 Tax=Blastopirellula sediminis TaxID=2894196 RepID=A0A9X1MKY4_9BACT|nr:phosphotransferase [Blastopirellula sediminis]MCC9609098.1 phosphotransferase [Blastopirellula sediminis]MCC9628125.1 phosphotransferase [Blastopirellula sediminis]
MSLSRFSEIGSRPLQITPLGSAGGLSGGAIWRVETDGQRYALRLWPSETTASRLSFVHSLQRQWREANLKFIPYLFATKEGGSFTDNSFGYWELAEWMPGSSLDPSSISPPQLDGVAAALAAIHHAAARPDASSEPSPGLRQRLSMLERWQTTDLAQVQDEIERLNWPDFAARGSATLQMFPYLAPTIRDELRSMLQTPLPLHACLRDIHRDHIFLTGALVTGVIDFGAVRMESCAGDLARLCGSLFEDDRNRWDDFLTRYERHRPLSAAERRAIFVFDRSSVLLTGLQWIEWIAVERRNFPQPEAVLGRLDISLRRLQFLLK